MAVAIFPALRVRGLLRKRDPLPKKDKKSGEIVQGEFNYFMDVAGMGFSLSSCFVSKEVYENAKDGEAVLTIECEPSSMMEGDYSRAIFRPRVINTEPPPAPKESAPKESARV